MAETRQFTAGGINAEALAGRQRPNQQTAYAVANEWFFSRFGHIWFSERFDKTQADDPGGFQGPVDATNTGFDSLVNPLLASVYTVLSSTPKRAPRSLEIQAIDESATFVKNLPAGTETYYRRFEFYLPFGYSSGTPAPLSGVRSGTNVRAQVRVNSAGALHITNSGGTIVATTSTTLSTATWYRVEHGVSLSAGTQTLRLYNDSDTLLEEITGAFTNGSFDNVFLGPHSVQTITVRFDNIADSFTGWVGPVEGTYRPAPTMRGQFANNSGAANASSVAATLPSGIVAGDVGYMVTSTNDMADTAIPPAGWETVAGPIDNGTLLRARLMRRVMDGTESGTTVTVSFTSGGRITMQGVVVAGAAGLLTTHTLAQDDTNDAVLDVAAATAPDHNSMFVHLSAVRWATSTGPTVTPPTGWTEVLDHSEGRAASVNYGGYAAYRNASSGPASSGTTIPATTGAFVGAVAQEIGWVLAFPPTTVPQVSYQNLIRDSDDTLTLTDSAAAVVVRARTATDTLAFSEGTPTPATRVFTEKFEGTSGAATTSNTGFTTVSVSAPAEGSATLASASAYQDNQGLEVLTSAVGTQIIVERTVSSQTTFVRYFMRWNAATQQVLLNAMDSGGGRLGGFRITSAGVLELRNGTANSGVTTPALSTGQWYRVEYSYTAGTPSQTLRVFRGANLNGTTPDDEITSTPSVGTLAAIRVGVPNGVEANVDLDIDNFAIDSTTWVGPVLTGAARTMPMTRTATETLTLTDTATRQVAAVRTGTDTSSLTDTATRTRSLPRSTTETLSLTDLATRQVALPRASTETLSLSDAATRTRSLPRTGTETLSFSDLAARQITVARTATDTLAPSDTAARTLARARSADDTLVLTDSATRAVAASRSATESLVLTDTATRALTSVRASIDSLSLSDAATQTRSLPRTGTDTASAVDTATRSAALARVSTDTLTTTDDATQERSLPRSATDTLAPSDDATRQIAVARSADETFTLTDDASQVRTLPRTATDTLTLTDDASQTRSLPRDGFDALTVTDVAERQVQVFREALDTLTLTDAASQQRQVDRQATDTSSVTDDASRVLVLLRSADDAETLTDEATQRGPNDRSAVDTLLIDDYANRQVTLARGASDALSFSDAASRQVAASRRVGEALVHRNLARNPSFETNVSSTTVINGSKAQTTVWAEQGPTSMRMALSTAPAIHYVYQVGAGPVPSGRHVVTPGQYVSGRAAIRVLRDCRVRVTVGFYNTSNVAVDTRHLNTYEATAGQVVVAEVIDALVTNADAAGALILFYFYQPGTTTNFATTGDTADVDGMAVYVTDQPTGWSSVPYMDGDQPGYSWEGTPHASVSRPTTDIATRAQALPRASTESLSLLDTVARQMGLLRSSTDGLAWSDQAGQILSRVRAASETQAVSDLATRLLAVLRSGSDATSGSESAALVQALARVTIETLTLSLAATRVLALARLGVDDLVVNYFPSNSSFEDATLTGFTPLGGWTGTLSTERARTGAQSLKIISDGTGGTGISRVFALAPGSYVASAWVWIPAGQANGTGSGVSIRTGGTGVPEPKQSVAANVRDQWVQIVHPFSITSGNLTFYLYGSSPAGNVVWYDDLSVVRSDAAVRALAVSRTSVDTLSRSEVAIRTVALLRASTDALVLADAAVRVLARIRSGIEASSTSETLSVVRGLVRSTVDYLASVEVASLVLAAVRSGSEVGEVVDSAERMLAVSRATTDLLTLADAAEAIRTVLVFGVENLLLADAASRGQFLSRLAVDSLPEMLDFVTGEVREGLRLLLARVLAVSRAKVGLHPDHDTAEVDFTFTRPVTAWSVRLGSTGPFDGVEVDAWAGLPAVTSGSATVSADALRVGANRLTVYGRGVDGQWAPER